VTAHRQEMPAGQQCRAGQSSRGRSAPAIPVPQPHPAVDQHSQARPSQVWSPSHNPRRSSIPADTRRHPVAAPDQHPPPGAAHGPPPQHHQATTRIPGNTAARSPPSHQEHRSATVAMTRNPAVYQAYAPNGPATNVSQQASSPTAHPTTADATNSRNPDPTGVPTPRSARSAQRSHDPDQPTPLPAQPHARPPAQATPQPSPEPNTPRSSQTSTTPPFTDHDQAQLNSYGKGNILARSVVTAISIPR
jgi:hypothetical protein